MYEKKKEETYMIHLSLQKPKETNKKLACNLYFTIDISFTLFIVKIQIRHKLPKRYNKNNICSAILCKNIDFYFKKKIFLKRKLLIITH